jgi:DNA-directed RNA polymerase subunit N (RpoN/RPB10)
LHAQITFSRALHFFELSFFFAFSQEVDEDGRTGWWERENWFPYWQAEHQGCRDRVALIDMSFMSKFLVQGPHAGRVLNRLGMRFFCCLRFVDDFFTSQA